MSVEVQARRGWNYRFSDSYLYNSPISKTVSRVARGLFVSIAGFYLFSHKTASTVALSVTAYITWKMLSSQDLDRARKIYAVAEKSKYLDEVIEHSQQALALKFQSDLLRAQLINKLAAALISRDQEGDVDEAFKLLKQGLALRFHDCSIHRKFLDTLVLLLKQRNRDDDLDLSIQYHRKFLKPNFQGKLARAGVPIPGFISKAWERDLNVFRGVVIGELASLLERRNKKGDVDEAIKLLKQGLDLNLSDLRRSILLNDLVKILKARNQEGDVDEAIQCFRDALDLDLQDNNNSCIIQDLNRFVSLLKERNQEGDLDLAIQYCERGLALNLPLTFINTGCTSRLELRAQLNQLKENGFASRP